MELSLYTLTGKGYVNGWWRNFKGRYRVYKGARNTKKSYDMLGYEVLDKILSDSRRNVLIVRNTFNSHKYSTFATLCMLIEQPDFNNLEVNLSRFFKINNNEMTIRYIPTGQLIIFKGMDDPQKIQSIRVPRGYLTDVYIEEAFELKDYDQFRKIDGSIRGKLPEGLFHQITFLLNGWDVGHWIYDKYFKGRFEDDYTYLSTHTYMDYQDNDYIGDYGIGLYLHTSTYTINEFRDTHIYDIAMENLRNVAPEIYKVEALGMWGNTTEAVYPEMSDGLIVGFPIVNNERYATFSIGIDTGLSDGEGKPKKGKDVKIRSATTMQLVGLSADYSKFYSIDEYFHSNETNAVKKTEPQYIEELVKKIMEWKELYAAHPDLMKGIIMVYVDSADIGFRQGLTLMARKMGLYNVQFEPSTKTRIQSRVDFIRLIMSFGEFLISEQCVNLIRELKHARRGENGKVREDIDDHAINANEYGWIPLSNKLKRWKQFKPRN